VQSSVFVHSHVVLLVRYRSVPAIRLIDFFEELIEPVVQRIRASLFQSRTLAQLRDALLPKLLSGEIRFKDAERIIGRNF
jgi:type I restriction enzyme, S subunit